MISYCRFADDYVVVLCQYSQAEAQRLKHEMAQWLQENLGLHPTPGKDADHALGRPFSLLGIRPARATQSQRDALVAI